MTQLNNTPNVTEHVAADAPEKLLRKIHRRGSLKSAKGIVQEWWWLRITAGLLVPLSVWLLVALITRLIGADQATLKMWLASPAVVIALALFLGVSFVHARLGVHEIIVDYVHAPAKKKALNFVVDLLSLVFALASLAAVWHLHQAA